MMHAGLSTEPTHLMSSADTFPLPNGFLHSKHPGATVPIGQAPNLQFHESHPPVVPGSMNATLGLGSFLPSTLPSEPRLTFPIKKESADLADLQMFQFGLGMNQALSDSAQRKRTYSQFEEALGSRRMLTSQGISLGSMYPPSSSLFYPFRDQQSILAANKGLKLEAPWLALPAQQLAQANAQAQAQKKAVPAPARKKRKRYPKFPPEEVGTFLQVWHGTKKYTKSGLTKDDLCRNKAGRVMSKKQHSVLPNNASGWFSACTQARKELGIKGFVTLNRGELGKKYYLKAKEIYAEMKKNMPPKPKKEKKPAKKRKSRRKTKQQQATQATQAVQVKQEDSSPALVVKTETAPKLAFLAKAAQPLPQAKAGKEESAFDSFLHDPRMGLRACDLSGPNTSAGVVLSAPGTTSTGLSLKPDPVLNLSKANGSTSILEKAGPAEQAAIIRKLSAEIEQQKNDFQLLSKRMVVQKDRLYEELEGLKQENIALKRLHLAQKGQSEAKASQASLKGGSDSKPMDTDENTDGKASTTGPKSATPTSQDDSAAKPTGTDGNNPGKASPLASSPPPGQRSSDTAMASPVKSKKPAGVNPCLPGLSTSPGPQPSSLHRLTATPHAVLSGPGLKLLHHAGRPRMGGLSSGAILLQGQAKQQKDGVKGNEFADDKLPGPKLADFANDLKKEALLSVGPDCGLDLPPDFEASSFPFEMENFFLPPRGGSCSSAFEVLRPKTG